MQTRNTTIVCVTISQFIRLQAWSFHHKIRSLLSALNSSKKQSQDLFQLFINGHASVVVPRAKLSEWHTKQSYLISIRLQTDSATARRANYIKTTMSIGRRQTLRGIPHSMHRISLKTPHKITASTIIHTPYVARLVQQPETCNAIRRRARSARKTRCSAQPTTHIL